VAFLGFLLILFASFAIDTAFVALFRAHKAGKFDVVRDDAKAFGFVSDTGRFNIYPEERKIGYTVGVERGTLAFDEVDGSNTAPRNAMRCWGNGSSVSTSPISWADTAIPASGFPSPWSRTADAGSRSTSAAATSAASS
jgi:hypothetical protein